MNNFEVLVIGRSCLDMIAVVKQFPQPQAAEQSIAAGADVALLAATGNFEEIAMHIRATANTGATKTDVLEAFQHVAIYAGVPRANHALKIAKATYAEMESAND